MMGDSMSLIVLLCETFYDPEESIYIKSVRTISLISDLEGSPVSLSRSLQESIIYANS